MKPGTAKRFGRALIYGLIVAWGLPVIAGRFSETAMNFLLTFPGVIFGWLLSPFIKNHVQGALLTIAGDLVIYVLLIYLLLSHGLRSKTT